VTGETNQTPRAAVEGQGVDKPIGQLRREYTRRGLSETEVDPDPIRQFDSWFDEAVRGNLMEPNAAALATATRDGRPAVRMVLLKGFDTRGFVFYTDFSSPKARDLAVNPRASLCFWWPELERQVRVDGRVTKVSTEEADLYFQTRPRESQLAAWASDQSAVVKNRGLLEERLAELEDRFADQDVPRPDMWGGFRLAPSAMEFWQGREHRLHDRIHYTLRDDGRWTMERLAP
jgi:pyridoxamine 5'-phosphate oxidase